MNRRKKAKLALEQEISERAAVATDCPNPDCRMPLPTKLQWESHRKLYPQHFTGVAKPIEKEEAVLVALKPKRSKQK